ncbi:hypothetical protein H5T51_08235 [Candidatus Bathyarchaeota archaeon]|nr:hypothetical protein [Candidatus Bathyarchaeota archaeon]
MGSNPTGPAIKTSLSVKAAFLGLLYELAFGTVLGRSQPWMEDGPVAGEHIDELKRRVEEQAKALDLLARRLDEETALNHIASRVEESHNALNRLAKSFSEDGLAGYVLNWSETRNMFLQYIKFKRYEPANARNMLNYLDRFIKKPLKHLWM